MFMIMRKEEDEGNKFISDSINEYFDAKEDDEPVGKLDKSEYFPVMENEWISPKQESSAPDSNMDSPYFGDVKITAEEKIRFISPPLKENFKLASTEGSPKINRSILNELLPTQVQLETNNRDDNSGENGWLMNDKIYGQIFKICFIIWLLTSIVVISSKPAAVISDNIKEITGWFTCCLVLGLAVTAAWAKILAEQTEVVVYGLMMAVPTGFVLLALLALKHFYIISAAVFITISAIMSAVIYFNKATLKTTVDIVHSAAIFIQARPKVYALALKLVAGYVVFVFIWLSSFSRLLLQDNTWSIPGLIITQMSFIFMLIWFGAVLSTVQKFLVATWVRAWMNQTEDSQDEEISAKLLDEKSVGTVCLAAGLLTAAKITRLTAKGTHFTLKTLGIAQVFAWLLTLISAAERFMQRFTDFSIYYLAVSESDSSEEGFVNSCKGMTRAIEGHLGLALTTDMTAQLLLSFSTVLISFTSTALVLFVAKKRISYYSSILIGLLAASVMDFVSNIYTSAIDATYLCNVMDLKRPDRRIDNRISDAFAAKISSV